MIKNNDLHSLHEVHSTVATQKKGWRGIMAFIGPAYLVSVGYMDPGNWATDIAGGSAFGYKLIWVLLMSNLIAVLLQSLSARLGIVRGMDLAQASKNAYPKWANIPLYILAEIAIAACDLAEIVGMAIGLNLLFGLPLIWGICLTALDTLLLLLLLHKGMRVLEAFIISLVAIIGISFLIEMFIVSPVYADVLTGFVPHKLSGESLYIAIGIIGATVMPHNLYLHSSLVQTRKFERTSAGMKKAIKFNLLDTTIALQSCFFCECRYFGFGCRCVLCKRIFSNSRNTGCFCFTGKIIWKNGACIFCHCVNCIRAKLNNNGHFGRTNSNGRPFEYQNPPVASTFNYEVTRHYSCPFYHTLFWIRCAGRATCFEPGSFKFTIRLRRYSADPFHLRKKIHERIYNQNMGENFSMA